MGSTSSVERLDARILKRAYYSLVLSVTGLVLVMVNWVGVTVNMYSFMNLHGVSVNTVIHRETPVMAALLGLSITVLPAVLVLNRLGNRLPMALGLIINGASMSTASTGDYYSALAGRFLSGMGMGLYMLPSLSYILGWWSTRRLTRWVQLAYLASFFTSMVASILVAGALTYASLYYLGIASALSALPVLALGRDAVVIRRIPAVAVLNNPDVILLSVAFSATWGTFLGLVGELGNAAILATAGTLLSLLAYRFRRIGARRRLLSTCLGAAYGVALASLSMGTTWASLVMVGALFATTYLSLASIINELVSPLLVVQVIGYLLSVSSALAPIFLYIGGLLADSLGNPRWLILGSLVIAMSLLYLRLNITPYFSDTSPA
jgi:MFS family permease